MESPGRAVTAVAEEQLPDAETIRALLDRLAGELGFVIKRRKNGRAMLVGADGRRVEAWREDYPYDKSAIRGASSA